MIEHSPEFAELAKALCAAQSEMTNAVKDATNPHFKSRYATLDAVIDAIRAPLTKNGLSFVQAPGKADDGGIPVTTMLMHVSGQFMRSTLYVPIKDRTPQGIGSCISYGRRYSLMSILGIAAADDDDAEAAMGRGEPAKANGNGARKSSAQAKRDGDWERLTAEIDKCTTLVEVWQWMDFRGEDVGKLPQTWREQVNEYVGKKLDELSIPVVTKAMDYLSKPPNPDALEKVAQSEDYKRLVADLPENQITELRKFYRTRLADLTADQVAA